MLTFRVDAASFRKVSSRLGNLRRVFARPEWALVLGRPFQEALDQRLSVSGPSSYPDAPYARGGGGGDGIVHQVSGNLRRSLRLRLDGERALLEFDAGQAPYAGYVLLGTERMEGRNVVAQVLADREVQRKALAALRQKAREEVRGALRAR